MIAIVFEPIVRLFVLRVHLLGVEQHCLSWRGDRIQPRSFFADGECIDTCWEDNAWKDVMLKITGFLTFTMSAYVFFVLEFMCVLFLLAATLVRQGPSI